MLETNVASEDVVKFLVDWLKTDIGQGEDPSEIEFKEEYYVSIYKSKAGNYDVEDNCGNRDLRRGILGAFIKDFKDVRNQMDKDEKDFIEEARNS